MKNILIIEDDQIVANVYRNKLAVEGYKVEVASDGEAGLRILRTFRPDLVILDLMLPTITGVDVIREIRSEPDFTKVPIIVFSNTYMTNLIQDAWRAGANKCLSKSSCTPKDVIEVVRQTIGSSGAMPQAKPAPAEPPARKPATTISNENDAEFQADLRKTFIDNLPSTLQTLRAGLQALIKADNEMLRLKQVYELYRQIHALNGNASVAGLVQIAHMSGAFEALLKEIYEKPKNINPSTIRTVASAVDFLGLLFEKGTLPDRQELPASKILVVDDEAISRRAIVYALEKAKLKSVNLDDPQQALPLLAENEFDLIFLDVDMPGMSGYELCAKLRALPQHKKTPVVFVTSLNDFDNRTSSTMAGGNDFIGKPFLFIELTVKALIHVMRAKFQPR
ncbi:MAG TPA: response regulator [Candidatus Acidoferrales bacterium]|jgi:CheY-like chemotaxis protein|nr:response regulator [Candidatus Acidoferrales bacterium]